jgi:hypothetical protein
MEKILSFDVGIIHLAYCFFTKKEYKEKDLSGNDKSVYKWDILDWSIIDLTDRDELKCSVCGKVATLQQTYGGLKYYCKTHAKQVNSKPLPYEQFYNELDKKKIGGCCFPIDDSICDKNCTMKDKNNNTFCGTHAKKLYQTMTNDMKMKPLKKTTVSSMDFDDTRLKLINILESKNHLLGADVVVIENQPSFKNPRMKSISALLYDYYMIRGIIDKERTKSNIKRVKFMSPSNKIKLASDGETQQIVKLKSTDKTSDESKAYKLTKSLAVKYAQDLLKHLPDWLKHFNSYKKKDDLADAFLQGAYYFEMNVKADPSEKVYKKKKGQSKSKELETKKASEDTKKGKNKKETSKPAIKIDVYENKSMEI